MKPTLTVFTPSYNRLHTITRTFESLCRQTCRDFRWLIIDDGSSDGTRNWVLSLGKVLTAEGEAFNWMGRGTGAMTKDHFQIEVPLESAPLQIEYVYKPNGGLYTGYNTAYHVVNTELCVCIDSDDWMPDNAVELICSSWNKRSAQEKATLAGLVGLDYNVVDKQPIGGLFATNNEIEWIPDLNHRGDSKFVFRTELMRAVAPQIGFEGEKDFNPHYMQMQVIDRYQMVVLNENICWVEYQIGIDSMSQAIFKQFVRSPRSYAKYRILEMTLQRHNGFRNKLRLCAHYVSSCLFANDRNWWNNCPLKFALILSIPVGLALHLYIKYKAKRS